MATKYAKAAGGNWSSATTWSATSSAGVDNAGAPADTDDVIFDTGANTAVVVDTTSCSAKSLTCQAAANSLTLTAAKILSVGGNITFYAGMTLTGTGVLIEYAASCTLNFAGKTLPGKLYFFFYGGTFTLASDLRCGTLSFFRVDMTFAGAYNIYCDTLILPEQYENASNFGITLTIPAGQTLNISTKIDMCFPTINYPNTIKSATPSSKIYLNYQGSAANMIIAQAIFTDVDASGSIIPINNWHGGTLTRCTNIINVTSANIALAADASKILTGQTVGGVAGSASAGGGGIFMPRARQIGV